MDPHQSIGLVRGSSQLSHHLVFKRHAPLRGALLPNPHNPKNLHYGPSETNLTNRDRSWLTHRIYTLWTDLQLEEKDAPRRLLEANVSYALFIPPLKTLYISVN